jgi:hypothetical protein
MEVIVFNFGAFCFGLVVGWVTYRTLRRTKTNGLSDISSVIGAIGGAAVVSLFPEETNAFGAYSIGLAIGFFAYLIVSGYVETRASRNKSFRRINRFLGSETIIDEDPIAEDNPIDEDDPEESDELPLASYQRDRST